MKGILEEKSFQFSIRMIKLYQFLTEERKEYIISKQIMRSGTSIGANIAEAKFAQSKADFVSKMSISLKEASETRYWLRLLEATNIITEEQFNDIMADCNELINILVASCKSAKNIQQTL